MDVPLDAAAVVGSCPPTPRVLNKPLGMAFRWWWRRRCELDPSESGTSAGSDAANAYGCYSLSLTTTVIGMDGSATLEVVAPDRPQIDLFRPESHGSADARFCKMVEVVCEAEEILDGDADARPQLQAIEVPWPSR